MSTNVCNDSNCAMNDNTYNGWKNRETWALNLWFNNDQGLYYLMQEYIEDCKENELSKESATIALMDFFEDWVEEQVERIENPVIKDMLGFDIDYRSIAESNLEDYDTEEEVE